MSNVMNLTGDFSGLLHKYVEARVQVNHTQFYAAGINMIISPMIANIYHRKLCYLHRRL